MGPQPTIAHYRITAKLGEGGMGEVWRATDTKLGRDVAIKILPEVFAQDPDRMARFTREAQVLASLNHPNIAQIYGVEERALVMELVPGPTLAEHLAEGAIPIDEALPIARQIAEALEYAHERGIVHRDLKPANIKITPEGQVKVLDFGLAKALSNDPAASDPKASPTLTMRATVVGTIMGTAAYMSPEQAKGKPVDRRADIWAFGVVVYEMLTGRQMYTGETVSETLAAVIKDTTDLNALPSATPPAVLRMIRRCLEKDPRRRLQSIGEARFTLEEPVEELAPTSIPVSRGGTSKTAWAIAGLLGIALIVALAFLWRTTRPVLRPMMRFSADLGPEAVRGSYSTAAISPDGTRIVFPVRAPGGYQLGTRLMDQTKATVLPGTEGGEQPFFSPDGEWIGFFADGQMKKISVRGGAAVTLCQATAQRGASWGEDGNIIADIDLNHLSRIPASGGPPDIIARPENKGQDSYRYPQILPGGKTILLSAGSAGSFDDANIAVLSLNTGALKIVQRGGYYARYLPSGHLIYMHQGTLFGVAFDIKRMETHGTTSPLIEGVLSNSGPGTAQLDFSQSGTLVYMSGKSRPNELGWMDAAGKTVPLASRGLTPRISPDGKQVATAINGDISVFDTERGAATRITFSGGPNINPVWSPDGKHIAYASSDGIWWTRADGSAQPVRILATKGTPGSFSPDGRRLAFYQPGNGTGTDVWILPLDIGDPDHPQPGKPELFVQTALNDMDPAFSPDGRWLAYASSASGSLQVYVRPYPASAAGGKWQISTSFGHFPIWSRTRKELFYETVDGRIMVVDYTAKGDIFMPGRPRQWCERPITTTAGIQNLDLAPDGQHFLAPLMENEPQQSVHVTFVVNFFDELKRRMP